MPPLLRAASGSSVSHFNFSPSDFPASGPADAPLPDALAAAAVAGGLDMVPPLAMAVVLGAAFGVGFFSSSQPAIASTRPSSTGDEVRTLTMRASTTKP